MLQLPDVTLVLVETREHDLAQLALEECERQAKFGDVVVLTDRPNQFSNSDRRVITVEDWPEKIGWSRCFWYDVPMHVRTSHSLGIQWDSWIIDPNAWRDEFLKYDYIGAPWWYEDGLNVGNGGFSLRSTALIRYIRKHRARFPVIHSSDDDTYCRKYRPEIQDLTGLRWAPERVAEQFAFEINAPKNGIKPFGFHAAMNFGKVLPKDDLLERARLMRASPGIANGRIWRTFADTHPDIIQMLDGITSKEKELSDG